MVSLGMIKLAVVFGHLYAALNGWRIGDLRKNQFKNVDERTPNWPDCDT